MSHQCLDEIQNKWERPIYKPITFNRETGAMNADKYAISVYNLTRTGKISRTGKATLFINFCPICGESLNYKEVQS